MTADATPKSLSAVVADLLPYLRRYARALTGTQQSGDRLAALTLETLLTDRSVFDAGSDNKVALFKLFHGIWQGLGMPIEDTAGAQDAQAMLHLSRLTPNTREALLLNTIEGFDVAQIGKIMAINHDEVNHLLRVALEEMERSITGDILVIEDEAIIALHINQIVTELGHTVIAVARKESEAVAMAAEKKPDLILSDIQLADGSSGVDAVNKILEGAGNIPVIFITAFPERLLTGDRPEPAFLLTKPYTEEQVRSAVSQAMFFASSEAIELT
jgi:CheY-like chemotaxis protein/DNA-directed RNA polymerase specialized sigma24 family protein